jgi:hypothetical protein
MLKNDDHDATPLPKFDIHVSLPPSFNSLNPLIFLCGGRHQSERPALELAVGVADLHANLRVALAYILGVQIGIAARVEAEARLLVDQLFCGLVMSPLLFTR